MNVVQVLKFPIGLAALSIIPVWILNSGASAREFTFWTSLAGTAGFAVNAAIATFRRYHVLGIDARPIRAGLSIVSSLTWCVLGLLIVVALCWGHLSNILSSEYYYPGRDSPDILATLALLTSGVLGFLCGVSGLFYLQHPSLRYFRTTNLVGFTTVATIFVWSLLSYGPSTASDAQSHAVGAALGTFLFTVAFPMLAACFMLLHLFFIKSLRTFISFDTKPKVTG